MGIRRDTLYAEPPDQLNTKEEITMRNEYISNWQSVKVFAQMAEIENGQDIHDALVGMALRKGMSREAGEALAARIMSGVYTYESTRETVEIDVQTAMAPLYEQLSGRTPEEQAAALDQILFGLEVFSDDELFLQAMTDSRKAYADHRGDVRFGPGSVEMLQIELARRMGNMNLSPKALDHMISQLTKSGDYTATAAALGRRGFALKSVAAMAAYLDAGEDADVTKAVISACASVDMQAVGDAVNRGLMARETAGVILALITIVVCALFAGICFGAGWAFLVASLTEAVPEGIFVALILMLAGVGMMELTPVLEECAEKAGDSVGKLTVLLSGLVRRGRESVENGLRAVAGHVAEKHRTADPFEADEEFDLDWEPEEAMEPIF